MINEQKVKGQENGQKVTLFHLSSLLLARLAPPERKKTHLRIYKAITLVLKVLIFGDNPCGRRARAHEHRSLVEERMLRVCDL